MTTHAELMAAGERGEREVMASLGSGTTSDGSQFALPTLAGGYTGQISPAVTVSTSIYAAGDVVGGKLTLANVVRATGGTAVLQSLFLQDLSNQKPALEILIFNADPAAGTYTDNGAFAVNTTDAAKLIRRIPVATTDWVTLGTMAIADISPGGKVLKAASGTSLYALIIVGGTSTPTFATTSALTVRFGVLQD